jgi:hypothetical protein
MSELIQSKIDIVTHIDADDIVAGMNDNDDSVLMFITQMLIAVDSIDLRERLSERLKNWDEEIKDAE